MRMMMINFWLAARIGRIWLGVQKGLRPTLGQMPDECMRVARGEPVPAGRVREAEYFAARAWYRAGLAACLPFVVALIAAVTIHGHVGRDIGAWSAGAAGGLATLAMSQYAYLLIKSWRLREHLETTTPGAADRPLEPGAPGRPRPLGFWVMLVLPAALFGFLLFASSQAAAGH